MGLTSFRQYIGNDVVQFARNNPSVSVYVRYRPRRHPRLVGEFRELTIPSLTRILTAPIPAPVLVACSEWKQSCCICCKHVLGRGQRSCIFSPNIIRKQSREAQETLAHRQTHHSGKLVPLQKKLTPNAIQKLFINIKSN